MRLGLVLLGVSPLLGLGCERAAPDPAECHELSLISHGLIPPGAVEPPQSPPLQISPRVAESVRNVTLRCITEPFDEGFVRCINEGGSPASCAQYSRQLRSSAEYAPNTTY